MFPAPQDGFFKAPVPTSLKFEIGDSSADAKFRCAGLRTTRLSWNCESPMQEQDADLNKGLIDG